MYIYAFCLNSNPALELPEGIWGSLELVESSELAALVEPHLSFESLQQSDRQLMQALLSHDRVIQELFQQTAVLPLRFGTYFLSRQKLLEHLRSHQNRYLSQLHALQGKAEYVLKLMPLSAAEAAQLPDFNCNHASQPQNSTEWQHRQQIELNVLYGLIGEHCSEFVHGSGSFNQGKKLYLLSAQQEISRLQTQLETWQQKFCSWKIAVGEALPPYHFV